MGADRFSRSESRSGRESPRVCGWARRIALGRVWLIIAAGAIVACHDNRLVDPPTETDEDETLISHEDDSNRPPELDSDSLVVVSDPVASASGADGVPARSASAETDVAYVTLTPRTVPDGEQATVRVRESGSAVSVPMVDGGFDPVPVNASGGETIEIEVVGADAAALTTLVYDVPLRRHPIVVRIDPPPRKRDVPLNANIVLVFSEPVADTTLTASSVQLFRGTDPVSGTVRLLEGSATTAVFEASDLLEPNTEYELVVTGAVRDLEGDSLETGVTGAFETGDMVLGSVEVVKIQPGADSGLVIPIGPQFQFTTAAYDDEGNVVTGLPVTWSSSNASVATVSATGLVTGIAEGETFLEAQVEGRTGTLFLRVRAGALPVDSVLVIPDSTGVLVGWTIGLRPELRNENGGIISEARPITWTSLDPSVATVVVEYDPRYATVTGVAEGMARIEAATEGKADTARVSVHAQAEFVLSPASPSIVPEDQVQLSAAGLDLAGEVYPVPSNQVAWSSSNPSVASVSSAGLVTGLEFGSATITGTWNGYEATASVTVVSLSFTTLSPGEAHTCGVASGGAAFCWGYNNSGQLGNGSSSSSRLPVLVEGGLSFASVSAGSGHTCGVIDAGDAYCWGVNSVGQLGDGTTGGTGCSTPPCSNVPVAVAGGLRFASLSVGSNHTCGITVGGAIYCWGGNWYGELGAGTSVGPEDCSGGFQSGPCSTMPVAVLGGLSFVSVSAGGYHTCGVTTDGETLCWGWNGDGQLGIGNATGPEECSGASSPCSTAPVTVVGDLGLAVVTAGASRTCGATTSGDAYCWGRGQLGDGTTESSSTPVAVAGGLTFTSMTAGGHTCGITPGGDAYCWGVNSHGQLGVGTTTASSEPVQVIGGLSFALLSAGFSHSCGLATGGTAYCWGYNAFGRLGDGTSTDQYAPVRVWGQP
jgi:alpha-tubulin suppressor-like RCC1 family protein